MPIKLKFTVNALDADASRQIDKSLKVLRGLQRARHERRHYSCDNVAPQDLFEHDEAWWLVDKSVWAEQPMID